MNSSRGSAADRRSAFSREWDVPIKRNEWEPMKLPRIRAASLFLNALPYAFGTIPFYTGATQNRSRGLATNECVYTHSRAF